MNRIDFYLGVFNGDKLIGVIDLGEIRGSFSFYGKKGLAVKPIEEETYKGFMKKNHPKVKID